MEGISVKSLNISIGMSFIVFLYLLDNETSYLILVPQGIAILIDVWKMFNASQAVKKDSFPYFQLKDK